MEAVAADRNRAPRLEEPDGAPRIASLDVMGGIAILGILFMNINTMGGSVWAMFAFDPRHLGWTVADRVAWSIRDIIADGTARCMLELLFGAGMAILTARMAAAGENRWQVLRRYGWRNLVLFLFGVAHLVLVLWGGDILHTYAASIMLVGAALYGWGILQGRRSPRFYALWTIGFYAVGLTIRAIGTRDALRFDDAPSLIWPLYEVGRLTTTFGHVGAIHLLLATLIGARLLRPFEAAGRAALSVYILQSLVCLWVLYPPWGLHLYGRQGWMALMLTAAVVDLGLLLLANWWVRRYRIAPVERTWRSIVERRLLPFRRGPSFAGQPLPA